LTSVGESVWHNDFNFGTAPDLVDSSSCHFVSGVNLCQAVCMHVNSYGDLCPGVLVLHVYDDLQSCSASEICPIDQQTSADAGLPHIRLFQSDDVICGGYRGRKRAGRHP
jgi:hypothetical protein